MGDSLVPNGLLVGSPECPHMRADQEMQSQVWNWIEFLSGDTVAHLKQTAWGGSYDE